MDHHNHGAADHDDGLVHGHNWARSDRPPHAAASHGPRPSEVSIERRRFHHAPRIEHDHDDGLVHDHSWARSERLSAYAAE
jgi:hypothetical protein